MSSGSTNKLTQLLGKGFASPPKPEDAPQNLKRAEVIPEAGAVLATMPEPEARDQSREDLNRAAAGDMDAANDRPAPAAKAVKPRVKREAAKPDRDVPEDYKQLNGRVPKDVHLRVLIASKVHEKDIGQIITEAFALWEAKNPSP